MKSLFRIIALTLAFLASFACSEDPISVTDVENPRAEKAVARYGETVTVTFMSELPWNAEIVMNQNPEEEWHNLQ